MNCLIVFSEELTAEPNEACLRAERAEYAIKAHDLKPGIIIAGAVWNGRRGQVRVKSVKPQEVLLQLSLTEESPPLVPASLIVAVPRPQTVKKVIQLAAGLGVRELHFIRTALTVKSYLQSHSLEPSAIKVELLKGMEQSGCSQPPQVLVHDSIGEFLRVKLPRLIAADGSPLAVITATRAAVLRQIGELAFTSAEQSYWLAIGPESGWTDQELQSFESLGFAAVTLGPRMLRVDTAAIYALGQLELLRAGVGGHF